MPEVVRALLLFALAGLAEIGGGWLVWQFLRESRPWPVGLVGAARVGRLRRDRYLPSLSRVRPVYAACGGILVVMALEWGYFVDGFRPDRWDLVGGAVCLIGVLIIFFGPREAPT